ncbi:MAG: response regulator, partial [Magnetococcales bacterium]|nr:response regulator [Magnetococcales bacterium]
INAIMGLTQLALGLDLSPKLRDYLEKVLLSSRSLLSIINDILDFSKIEAGRMDLDAVDFDLEQVLENVNNLFAIPAMEKNIELFVEVRPDVPCYLNGDPLRFGQIVNNLVGNAVKFTETGEVRVVVDCGHKEEGRVQLQVSVSDTGIGMPSTEIQRLFQPFHQADGSISRRYGGTGLGLAITRNLVEKMEGNIQVESSPGEGSCFRFNAWLQEPLRIKPTPHPHQHLPFQSVMVVDDSATSREILRSTLEKWGLAVTEISSGQEALPRLRQEKHPDLLLVDLLMPDMDGLTLLRHMQEEFPDHTMAVILMSASMGHDSLLRESTDIRKNAIVNKPITPSSLFDAIMTAQGTGNRQIRMQAFDANRWRHALRGAKILLVEDNAINQQVAVEFLQLMGIEVTCANNGREAIIALQQTLFDLVLMDLQMPDMDGFEATRIIRREEAWKNLPIIAMTAAAMTQDRKRCLDAGMNEHVAKPIEPERLAEVLKQWLPAPAKGENEEIPPAPQPSVILLPDNPPGFDLEQALKPLGGNLKLWRSLVGRFAADFAEMEGLLNQCIARQDRKEEERLVHRLRGAAGSLGAITLFKCASELEQLLRNDGDPESARKSFRHALAEALASAKAAGEEDTIVAVVFDPEKAQELLSLIAEHISVCRFVPTHITDETRALFATTPLSKEVEILLRQLDQFDFEAAGEQLERVRGKGGNFAS